MKIKRFANIYFVSQWIVGILWFWLTGPLGIIPRTLRGISKPDMHNSGWNYGDIFNIWFSFLTFSISLFYLLMFNKKHSAAVTNGAAFFFKSEFYG